MPERLAREEQPVVDLLMRRTAIISECGLFRYLLERIWGDEPPLPFCCLNPSRADAEIDDLISNPHDGVFTAREGWRLRARQCPCFPRYDPEGHEGRCVDPFGPDNETYLMMIAAAAAQTGMPLVCAWATLGDMLAAQRRRCAFSER